MVSCDTVIVTALICELNSRKGETVLGLGTSLTHLRFESLIDALSGRDSASLLRKTTALSLSWLLAVDSSLV